MAEALSVRRLEAWYGESKVVHGMDFSVGEGEVVALLGRNGAGKTTTLKAIMGLLQRRTGSIRLDGEEIIGAAPFDVARKGIAFCPEERGIFASLSVRENLLLPPKIAEGGIALDEVLNLFPNLKERLDSQGSKLSGGEQQMLALARILRTGARVLLLDEPTEGLAPVIIQQIGRMLSHLKSLGFTILLVEQNAGFVCGLADRHYVVETGRVVDEIAGDEFERRLESVNNYLGL
ncbi:ABC transporter ATP-binding protein [Bradyrhizobium iriomotense]|uniref:ABC transporter ATP-binding protein n=1 Tax=Bradyrhizobium iriomotense TaxID=441950 RepID=UPI001B8A4357|nr:ABC transporter ATP-binding protein [Bradyrhizobium iriomotense]MBR1133014.1 ABC transporter ATP-binding protein [Bradyrhizobium iriomotense]